MKKIILPSLAICFLVLSGCSEEQNRDAPRESVDDTSPAKVIQMPDGFSNIATKCIPGTHIRIASIYHWSNSETGASYGAVSMVQDDTCKVG